MTTRFLDPRERTAYPLRKEHEDLMAEKASQLSAFTGNSDITDLESDIATALAGSDDITCFKCETAIDMDSDDWSSITTHVQNNFVAGVGDSTEYEQAELGLCSTCKAEFDTYIAAQEV